MAVSVPQQQRLTTQEDQILAGIASEIGESLFALWFSSRKCVRVKDNTVSVVADSDFEARRIQKGYASLIRRVATSVLGRAVNLEFSVREIAEQQPEPRAVSPSPKVLRLDPAAKSAPRREPPTNERISAKPRFSLRDFAFGTENEFARAAVKQVLQFPGQFSPLLIYGGSGSGKTHLLEALTSELRATQRLQSCIYMTAEQFTSSFVHSLRGGGLPNFRRKYRDVDVLAIDDVHFFANKRATIAELQHTIDHLTRAGKQVIFSSDRAPIELVDLGNEVLNRLNSGLVCPLYFAAETSRVEIVNRLCRERGLDWSTEIRSLIANKVCRDGRRINGAINRICATSTVRRHPVSLDMVQESLGAGSGLTVRMTTISQIEKVIADLFAISAADMRSTNRSQKVGNARMLAMYFCRKHTTAALSEIGEHFGRRSHSTVISAVRRIEEIVEQGAEIPLPLGRFSIKDVIESIENKLRIG